MTLHCQRCNFAHGLASKVCAVAPASQSSSPGQRHRKQLQSVQTGHCCRCIDPSARQSRRWSWHAFIMGPTCYVHAADWHQAEQQGYGPRCSATARLTPFILILAVRSDDCNISIRMKGHPLGGG